MASSAVGRWLAIAMVAILLAAPPAALALNDAQQLVVEAWKLVNLSYVDPQQLETLGWRKVRQRTLEKPITTSVQAYDAIEAMLAPLGDPYTRLLRPDDYSVLRSSTQGTVSGVGLQLALRGQDQTIVVIAPLDGSPAAQAEIASGSEVLRVDGDSTQDLGLEGTAARLRGPAGTDVLVTVRGPEGGDRDILLPRREVNLQPVRFRILNQGGRAVGYLRITQFSDSVPQLVRNALLESGEPFEALILDLRNNSGGLVSAGVAVASDLLDGTVIVETADRGGHRSPPAGRGRDDLRRPAADPCERRNGQRR